MFFPATLSLPDRFAEIIGGLCRALSAQSAWCREVGPLGVLIWGRLCRMRTRFTAIAARVQAGTLPAVAPARPRAATPRPATPRPAAAPDQPRLPPPRIGWLVRLVPEPWHLNSWRVPLEELLADPQTAALAAVAPQVGRELRPLCRMLNVEVPPELRLPKRPRRPRVVKPRPPKVETPEELDARVRRMPRLAFANLINPEREPMWSRPPNKLGYGRAPPIFRPPPKRD
jgi:hypothetical protein